MGSYGLSLLNNSPDDPEEEEKEEEPPRPQLPQIQTKTRDSRQQAQRELRLMKAVVLVVFGANAFCAGLCSIGYLYDFYIWVINTCPGSESAKHWAVFIVQAVSFLGGFLLFIHGLSE